MKLNLSENALLSIRLFLNLLVIIVYLVIGGVIFARVEEKHRLASCSQQMEQTVEKLQSILSSTVDVTNLNKTQIAQALIPQLVEVASNHCTPEDTTNAWTIPNSMFYSLTVITTIGYGNKSPASVLGKCLTVPYAIIGFGIFGCFITLGTQRIERTVETINKFLHKRVFKQEYPSKGRKSETSTADANKVSTTEPKSQKRDKYFYYTHAIYCTVFLLVYILVPATIFHKVEGWDYWTSLYYVFVTLSTIGFGDFYPTFQHASVVGTVFYEIYVFLWISIGIVTMAYSISLATRGIEEKHEKWDQQILQTRTKNKAKIENIEHENQ